LEHEQHSTTQQQQQQPQSQLQQPQQQLREEAKRRPEGDMRAKTKTLSRRLRESFDDFTTYGADLHLNSAPQAMADFGMGMKHTAAVAALVF
jgi:hypothetical protein